MTISFPREMPELAGNRTLINQCEFKPYYQQAIAASRGGLVQVQNTGATLWSMTFTTAPLEYQQAMEWMSWLQSLRGGARMFKAWHPLRRYPYLYPNGFGALTRAGGGAFDGTCTLYAIGTNRDKITLSNLPASFAFSIGDMISFPIGSSRCLVQVMEAVTASGGGSAEITIEPTIPLAATAGTTDVTLVKPWCLAVVDAKSINGPIQPGYVQSVSFQAMQTY